MQQIKKDNNNEISEVQQSAKKRSSKKGKKLLFISTIILFISVAILGISIVIMAYRHEGNLNINLGNASQDNSGNKSTENIDTTTSETEVVVSDKVIDRSEEVLVLKGAEIYRVNILTKESNRLNIPEVTYEGASSVAGSDRPHLSNTGRYLAFTGVDGFSYIYDFETEDINKIDLPINSDYHISNYFGGYSATDGQLLITHQCADNTGEGYIELDCNTGERGRDNNLYIYDLKIAKVEKITFDEEASNYEDLYGWAPYDDNKVLIGRSTYKDNSISKKDIFEIDMRDGTTNLVKSFGYKFPNGEKVKWINFADVDKDKNMLFTLGDQNDDWTAYYLDGKYFDVLDPNENAVKIKKVDGFSNLQFLRFLGNNGELFYYSRKSDINESALYVIDKDDNQLQNYSVTVADDEVIHFIPYTSNMIVQNTSNERHVLIDRDGLKEIIDFVDLYPSESIDIIY